jgi:nucleotide-binding universal stress UspA family protein
MMAAYDSGMMPFRRLLVALAGRESDVSLLRYAGMLRQVLREPEILCLHVDAGDDRPGLREHVTARVAALLPGARCEWATGDVLDTILGIVAMHGADLTLIGHSSRSRRRSLARRVAMKSPSSVWMAPDEAPATFRSILIPIDFSRRSADTVATATALAEAAGLEECLALHVHFNEAVVTFDEFDDILAEDRDRAFGLFIAPIDLHGIWVKPLFADSCHVADTIVRTAGEHSCDLIVMGTRGRSPSAAVLLGSETEQCLMTSPVPVLAVKHFGTRLSLLQALRDERLRKRGEERFT